LHFGHVGLAPYSPLWLLVGYLANAGSTLPLESVDQPAV
jgi:hypothetical protein